MTDGIAQKTCTPCRGGVAPLTQEAAEGYLSQTPGWELEEEAQLLRRKFKFTDFRQSPRLRRQSCPIGGTRTASSRHLLRLGLCGSLASDTQDQGVARE